MYKFKTWRAPAIGTRRRRQRREPIKWIARIYMRRQLKNLITGDQVQILTIDPVYSQQIGKVSKWTYKNTRTRKKRVRSKHTGEIRHITSYAHVFENLDKGKRIILPERDYGQCWGLRLSSS